MHISQGFQQAPLVVSPAWTGLGQAPLRALCKRVLPPALYDRCDQEMREFQIRLAGPIHEARLQTSEPTLRQYDQWGRRVDELVTSEGWRKLKANAAEEGFMALSQDQEAGEYARMLQFVKAYLWLPECAYVGCPLAMTDGSIRVIELAGTPEMKANVMPRLLSTDPTRAWTAGQWMTERPGGSDVSLTETIARRLPNGGATEVKPGDLYEIDGFKWFSSATDGDVAVALARTGDVNSGARGLSLFLIPLRNPDGSRVATIRVHRLKKKFGTKALPTAELELQGAVGQLIGKEGQGVKMITPVLNITRVHSAVSSVAALSHTLEIARAFALVRRVGGAQGTLLAENEMHTSVLAQSELVLRALQQLVFNTVHMLGATEVANGRRGDDSSQLAMRLRLLTPVAKSFCARLGSTEILKLMDALGGQGYMEENDIPRLLADASVENVWEGTTNTLALDVVRVLIKSKGLAVKALADWVHTITSRVDTSHHKLGPTRKLLEQDCALLIRAAQQYSAPVDPRLARPILFLIGFLASSACLLEHALWSASNAGGTDLADPAVDELVAIRWADHGEYRETRRTIEGLLHDAADGKPASRRDAVGERTLEKLMVYGTSKL